MAQIPTEEEVKAILIEQLNSGMITRDEAARKMESYRKMQQPKGSYVSAIYEPTKAVIGSLYGEIKAGYSGLGHLVFGNGLDAAAESVERSREGTAESVAPETQRGQAGLENIGDLMKMGLDVAQFTVSGLGGIAELLTGQDREQVFKTVNDIKTKGITQTAGDRVFETTGSPLFATTAAVFPEIIGAAIPVASWAKRTSALHRSIASDIRSANSNPDLGRAISAMQEKVIAGGMTDEVVGQFDSLIAASPKRIQGELIEAVNDMRLGIAPESIARRLGRAADSASSPAASTEIANYVLRGSNGIKADKLANEAIKQGFDQGVISSVKAGTPVDRAFMRQMVDVMEQGKKDKLYATTNRPSDIAGQNLLARVNHIKAVNKQAGADLDDVAKGLKGKNVDFSQPIDNFLNRLDDMGINLDGDLNLSFVGSDIEGVTAAENAIKHLVNRMKTSGVPDGYDLHRLKKYIDEQVSFGAKSEGLTGKAENVLKQLRHDIDGSLDSQFPDYNTVNTTYADTVNALDMLQDVAGKKVDLFGANADKAVGTLLRRLMSNAQSRVNLLDSVNELESVSRKYGGRFDDSIKLQVLFADELDSVFGTTARTSFQGSVGEGVKQGIEMATGQKTGLGMLTDALGSLTKRARNINEDGAFEAIKKVLDRDAIAGGAQ